MELSGGNKFKWVKKHGHEDAGYLLFTSRVYFSVSFFSSIHPSITAYLAPGETTTAVLGRRRGYALDESL